MNIKKMINGEILTLYVAGRIDTTNAKEFEDVINSELKDITGLIMDFAELEYISSAGLRVLLIAIKQMKKQGSMKIVHSNEMVKEIFEVTGFADLVEVE
ncbi:MAG: STAS domain-containing protein [Lachnospiraceae bacterium]|nr:STAS domain-containing protein [Lachnospiraceae bacterium]